VIRIDVAKWRSVLTRSAIVVLVFVLLLEITFMDINIISNSLSQYEYAYVLLSENDAYALVIESLPNVKYRVDVTLWVVSGSALVILNNGSKVLIEAGLISPPPVKLTLTRDLKYGGFISRCFSSYTWLNINGSLFKSDSPVSISGNSTFKVIVLPFELSRERPVNANLLYLGPLSTSTLSNATYLVDVLNATACGGAVKLTPALIVVGLSNGTIIDLSWYWVVVDERRD
jgi:hypothetical protein